MVAGAHALSELPDEITTPGRGQIRAMVINCGNPVVSGPDGADSTRRSGELDLLVAIDFVQRESHRHAHWLLPAVHWLERDDLLAFTSNMHDEPYVQYGAQAVEPPPGAREEWRIFVDLALAMKQAAVRREGAQRLHQGHAGGSHAMTGEAGPGVRSALDRPTDGGDRHEKSTAARSNGATSSAIRTAGCWARANSATSGTRCALRRQEGARRAAGVRRARARTARRTARPVAPAGYPFQLGNRRNRHSMNSWLNELPGLHPSGKGNEVVITPADAAAPRHRRRRPGAGVLAGRSDRTDRVAVDDQPRRAW